MTKKRICMACDLKNEPHLIAEYKEFHAKGNVWQEVTDSLVASGIEDMEIYLIGNRLFMIMEVNAAFSPEIKAERDAANDKVSEWEELMMNYQQLLPFPGIKTKWVEMENIFKL